MIGKTLAKAAISSVAAMLAFPACAWADMGLVQKTTSEGTIVYYDFDGIGYALIIVIALVLIFRGQRKTLKRMAAGKRRARRGESAAGEPADPGAEALAAVERLKRAEQAARAPKKRVMRQRPANAQRQGDANQKQS